MLSHSLSRIDWFVLESLTAAAWTRFAFSDPTNKKNTAEKNRFPTDTETTEKPKHSRQTETRQPFIFFLLLDLKKIILDRFYFFMK